MGKKVAIDLDGTIAEYQPGYAKRKHIGEPIKPIMDLAKKLDERGQEVIIFTARVHDKSHVPSIKAWLKKHGLGHLKITNIKTPDIAMIIDDRAVQVERNTGKMLGKPKLVFEAASATPGSLNVTEDDFIDGVKKKDNEHTLQGGEVMNGKLYDKIFGESGADGVPGYEGEEAGTKGRKSVDGMEDITGIKDAKLSPPKNSAPEGMKNMNAQGGDDGDLAGDPAESTPPGQMQTKKKAAGQADGPDKMARPGAQGGDDGQQAGERAPATIKKDSPKGMFESASGALYEKIFGPAEDYTDIEESYDDFDEVEDYVEESYEDEDYEELDDAPAGGLYEQVFGSDE